MTEMDPNFPKTFKSQRQNKLIASNDSHCEVKLNHGFMKPFSSMSLLQVYHFYKSSLKVCALAETGTVVL